MEHHHEDNAHFENIVVHNSQNLMENLQFGNQQGEGIAFAAVGDQSEAIVGGGLGGIENAGCKFEEHIERGDGDDDELKYIKEKHQNEKQQHHNYDLFKAMGNGDGPGHNVDTLLMTEADEHHIMGNGAANAANGGTNVISAVAGDEEEVEIIKNDGDFSTTSNATTSTTQSPGDDKDVAADLLQVEMKIETAPQQHGFEGYMAQGAQEEIDEEEPSSLATNGTSSLSENQLQPQATEPQLFGEEIPFVQERLVEVNFDHHSKLNPEAQEFVPSFGSNPASPTMTAPIGGVFGMGAGDSELPHFYESTVPHPTSSEVARHIFGEQRRDDDFVAQSPHKERYVDMEAISLPEENEFDNEAARRPHELEKEELLLGEADNVAENKLVDNTVGGGDCQDFNHQSPVSFIDHGPETSVDLDNDIVMPMQPVEDVMKQSIYVESTHNASDEQIENLLNTVQPLPTESESLNASFNDEHEFIHQLTNEREIFDSEVMEHVTQMNLQNNLNSHTHAEEVSTIERIEQNISTPNVDSPQEEQQHHQLLAVEERSFLMDTSNPLDSNNDSLLAETEASFEIVHTAAPNDEVMFEEQIAVDVMPPQTLSINEDLFKHTDESNITPSPHSTEEKHLVEETKEAQQLFAQDDYNSLGLKLDDMHITPSDDGNSAQMEPAVEIAAVINENANPFILSEHEHEQLQSHKPESELIEPPMVETIRNEQISVNEQILLQDNECPQVAVEAVEQHEKPKSEVEIVAEPIAVAQSPEPILTDNAEAVVPLSVEEDTSAVTAAAVAATAAAATVAAISIAAKKPSTTTAAKKPSAKSSSTNASAAATTAAKTKPTADLKKQVEVKKSSVTLTAKSAASSTTATARPRTAPVKRSIDKPAGSAATGAAAHTAAAAAAKPAPPPRKAFTARPAPKTTTAAPRAATASCATKPSISSTNAARPATARTITSSTTSMRKPLPAASSTTVNVKSRVISSTNGSASPTKPTTLGLASSAKPKHISPRATLTSQLRKTASPISAAKSPIKPIAGVELTAKASGANLASRTKTTGGITTSVASSTTTTTTTKRFVARPAPKFNAAPSSSSSTTTTSRRGTVSGTTNAPTTAASKTNTASKRLTSPTKQTNANKLSPVKSNISNTAGAKSLKAKEAPIKSSKETVAEPKTNGEIVEPHLNGNSVENGVHIEDENIQNAASPTPEVINLIDA